MTLDDLRDIPAWWWIAGAALAGTIVLAWHRYCTDHTDTDWTTPSEIQPPTRAPYSCTPCLAKPARPMDVSAGFRSRSYPGNLVDAEFSIIGEF